MHIKLKYGNTHTFFIRGMSGNLLVDTDYAGTLPAFYRAIKECKIKISDITYILATHYHPDHIGLVSELMNQGVKLLVIDIQYSYIHFADSISLILDSGECFVGDLEPIEYLAAYEQNDRLKYDWELVMHNAPKKIYYAHANEKYCD